MIFTPFSITPSLARFRTCGEVSTVPIYHQGIARFQSMAICSSYRSLLCNLLKSVYSFSVLEYQARHSVTTLNITIFPNDRWPTTDTLSVVRKGDLPTSNKNLHKRWHGITVTGWLLTSLHGQIWAERKMPMNEHET